MPGPRQTICDLKKPTIVIALCAIVLSLALTQASCSSAAADMQRKTTKTRPAKIWINSIKGQQANAQDGLSLDMLQEGGEIEVTLGVGPESAIGDNNLWLLINRQDTQSYSVFGPAKVELRDGREVWVIQRVVIPFGQAKDFYFRAAVSSKDYKPAATQASLDAFSTVSSPPVPVTVHKWTPRPGALAITTIGKVNIGDDGARTVKPGLDMEVDAIAQVSGTYQQPNGGNIYLILHPENTDIWRVEPAEKLDKERWLCREVSFTGITQPGSRYIKLFAVQSNEPLQSGALDYKAVADRMNAVSHSLRVWVKEEKGTPSPGLPEVVFTRYRNSDGSGKEFGDRPDQVSLQSRILVKDAEVSLEGFVKNRPQGKSLWVLINPRGTSLWVVYENAAVITGSGRKPAPGVASGLRQEENAANDAGDLWDLPRVKLEAPGDASETRFRLMLAVANDKNQTSTENRLRVGVVDDFTARDLCDAVSPMLNIEVDREPIAQPIPQPSPAIGARSVRTPDIRITRIAGVELDSANSGEQVEAPGYEEVEVEAENLPADGQVWIGAKREKQGSEGRDARAIWNFTPAIRTPEGAWRAPKLALSSEPTQAGKAKADAVPAPVSIVAIATHTSLPSHYSDYDTWRHYAWAVSPSVKVISPAASKDWAAMLRSAGLPWLALLLGSLIVIGYAMATERGRQKNRPANLQENRGEGELLTEASSNLSGLLGLALISILILIAGALSGYHLLGYFLLLPLIVAATVLLGRRSRLVSQSAGEVRRASEATYNYIQSHLSGIPRPHVVRSVLGIVLLGVGLFAVWGYFPIYRHILQEALGLNREQSHSLALLLIIFIGLTGVMADITSRFGRRKEVEADEPASRRQDDSRSEASGRFVFITLMATLGLIALALLMFQGILYLEFYQSRVAQGSRIPFAFGASALFIAGIEMLNFYWATRLAFDFIAWVFVHVFLLIPPALLARWASLVEVAAPPAPTRRLQERIPDDPVARPTTELNVAPSDSEKHTRPISREEAEQVANLYILTKLGDHLRISTLNPSNGDWVAVLVHKETKQIEGELIVKRGGAVEWRRSTGDGGI